MNIRNAVKSLITSTVLAGTVVSCGGGDDDSTPAASTATVIRTASLGGVAPIAGTGRGAVVVNPTTKEITGGITFTGLTGAPTGGAHIHSASEADGIIITLTIDNPTATTTVATIPADTTLTDARYAALLAGQLYFNVHTVANSGGEIRGQINGQGGVIAGLATLNGAQENSTNTSTATGRGTIVVDSALPYKILIAYVTHNVSGSNNAHIHTGALGGAPGPANVVQLTQGTNVWSAPQGTTITAQNATDLSAGNTYFNIHSLNNLCPPAASCSGGEIRGQIAIQ